MDLVQKLLTENSIEYIIIFSIGLIIALKFFSELWDWFYIRIKKHFNIRSEKEQQETEDRKRIEHLEQKIDNFMVLVEKNYEELNGIVQKLIVEQDHTIDRLQENTRSFIIDRHHYFCYQLESIDDISLQSLERRYMYYKAEGGNTYIDHLMEEIRRLPIATLQRRDNMIKKEWVGDLCRS